MSSIVYAQGRCTKPPQPIPSGAGHKKTCHADSGWQVTHGGKQSI